jgi:hypothetical protein
MYNIARIQVELGLLRSSVDDSITNIRGSEDLLAKPIG